MGKNYCSECHKKDFRYREQTAFLNELASRLGFVRYRPDYHAAPGDCNTVLLYTREDEDHNRKVDKQPTKHTRSEANDWAKRGVTIHDDYIYRDAFFTFENTDVNGRYDTGFANHGKLDLRGPRWKDVLEGTIRIALAHKKQRVRCHENNAMRGEFFVEADEVQNDLNRELISAFYKLHGKAFLGSVNFYGEKNAEVAAGGCIYEEYTGQKVCNFDCDFVISERDEDLQRLVSEWNKPGWPKSDEIVDKIHERIDKLGIRLIWT